MQPRNFQELYELEETYWWFVGRRQLVQQLVRRYVQKPGARILDAGCGTGGTLKALQGLTDLYGCDVSREALAFCRQRSLKQLVAADVLALPYASASFQAVISCDVLEHLPDDQAGLREMLRVLQPGGFLFITVPAHRFLWSEHDEALGHRRRYRAKELRQKLQEAGANVLKLSAVVMFAFPPILLFRIGQRLRPKLPDEPRTDLRILKPWLNKLLIKSLQLENWLLQYLNLPLGTSYVAVAQKPENVK